METILQKSAKSTMSETNSMKGESSIYLLIAGAWSCGWFWNSVKEKLELAGHRVLAIDLPGHGDNQLPLEKQDLSTYACYVAGIVAQQSKPVILVGHSMAGGVVCQVAEYQPNKIERLVILCGFLLNDGESINGLHDGIKPTDWTEINHIGLGTLSADQKITYIHPEVARRKFFGTMSDDESELAIEHLSGEAIAAQWQAAKLGENFKKVTKIYIKTLQDQMLPLGLQEEMSERQVETVYTLNSDHFPFLTASTELTEVLLQISASSVE